MHCTVGPRELYNCTRLESLRSAALTCVGAVVTLVTSPETSPLAAGSDGSADGDTASDEVFSEVFNSLKRDHRRLGEDGGTMWVIVTHHTVVFLHDLIHTREPGVKLHTKYLTVRFLLFFYPFESLQPGHGLGLLDGGVDDAARVVALQQHLLQLLHPLVPRLLAAADALDPVR